MFRKSQLKRRARAVSTVLNFGIRGRCIARAGPPEWLGESDWTNGFVCTPKKNSPRKAG
jgi:hypothetical protein